MKKCKNVLSFVASLMLMLSLTLSNVYASTSENDSIDNIYNKDGHTLKQIVNYTYDKNGNVIGTEILTDEEDIKTYIQSNFLSKQNTNTLKSINNSIDSTLISTRGFFYSDKRVIKGWTSSWRKHLQTEQGGPGGTVEASIDQGFSTTVSKSVSVTDGVIEAGIGTDITSSINIIQSYSHPITDGKFGYIDVGVNITSIDFDIEGKDLFTDEWETIGSGYYEFVSGASFYFYEN